MAQHFDHGFAGPVANRTAYKRFRPTFTIDADRILTDEQIGDAAIEGKPNQLTQ